MKERAPTTAVPEMDTCVEQAALFYKRKHKLTRKTNTVHSSTPWYLSAHRTTSTNTYNENKINLWQNDNILQVHKDLKYEHYGVVTDGSVSRLPSDGSVRRPRKQLAAIASMKWMLPLLRR